MTVLIEPEETQVSIVLIGQFNPAIFHPAWFRETGLFSDVEAAAINVDFMHPEITKLSGEWFTLQVQKERFSLEAVQPPFIQVYDLTLKIFGEFLTHTPVTRLGINFSVKFDVKNFETRHKLGRTLAPIEPWGSWGDKLDERTDENVSGVRRLIMEQCVLDDHPTGFGHVQTTIEPGNGPARLQMRVNNDYQPENSEDSVGASVVMDILEKSFEQSIKRSEIIVNEIMKLSRKLES